MSGHQVTHVGFRAHVNIASRIVSLRSVNDTVRMSSSYTADESAVVDSAPQDIVIYVIHCLSTTSPSYIPLCSAASATLAAKKYWESQTRRQHHATTGSQSLSVWCRRRRLPRATRCTAILCVFIVFFISYGMIIQATVERGWLVTDSHRQ